MGDIPLGLVVEMAVAVLLVLTIGYCVVLNDRLKKLHADRDLLRQMVVDLVSATDLANKAIGGLREAATEADATLDGRLREAEHFAMELANHVSAGQSVMDRIARITDAAKRHEVFAEPAPIPEMPPEPRGAQAALDRLSAFHRRRENAA